MWNLLCSRILQHESAKAYLLVIQLIILHNNVHCVCLFMSGGGGGGGGGGGKQRSQRIGIVNTLFLLQTIHNSCINCKLF